MTSKTIGRIIQYIFDIVTVRLGFFHQHQSWEDFPNFFIMFREPLSKFVNRRFFAFAEIIDKLVGNFSERIG